MPVSRASTLRSSVSETLPDASQHWYGYLRLSADLSLTIVLFAPYHKELEN